MTSRPLCLSCPRQDYTPGPEGKWCRKYSSSVGSPLPPKASASCLLSDYLAISLTVTNNRQCTCDGDLTGQAGQESLRTPWGEWHLPCS